MLPGIMEIEKIIEKVLEKPENFLQLLAGVICAIVAVVGILQLPYLKSKWFEFPIERIPPVTEGYTALFFIIILTVACNWLTRHKK